MKTRAMEFSGPCSLNWCNSNNDTKCRGGVEVLIEDRGDLDDDIGKWVCCDCALKLSRLLKKRVQQVQEKQASGLEYRLEYRADGDGLTPRWRKRR